jgi:hypothetical protein
LESLFTLLIVLVMREMNNSWCRQWSHEVVIYSQVALKKTYIYIYINCSKNSTYLYMFVKGINPKNPIHNNYIRSLGQLAFSNSSTIASRSFLSAFFHLW